MAQDVKIIDIRRSYRPVDPNAFPETMHGTQGEDQPEERIPVIAYDGHNFMPTQYGYQSYFGIGSKLNIDAITANIDDIFILQRSTDLQNILFALADDGIYTKIGSNSGAWTQVISLLAPPAGEHKNWSKCVIENELFLYRQGEASVWRCNAANNFVPTAYTPSFLNMAGQLGIFKAGGRLGFWDSENSISWSALGDPTDVTPDPNTLAGNTIFQDIVGKIVVVLQHAEGFIIYCTKSIVLVTRNPGSPMLWKGVSIANNNGISYREEAVANQPDTIHFAYTTFGIAEIVNGKLEYQVPELFDLLKENRKPVYLKMFAGRFLFFNIIDPNFITGIPNFSFEEIPATFINFQAASYAIQNIELNICKAYNAVQNYDKAYIYNVLGFSSYKSANTPSSVPIWRDNISSVISNAIREAWKNYTVGFFGDFEYFNSTAFTNGNIPKITTGNESFIPANGPQLAATFAEIITQENNDKHFFLKQEMIWWAEDRFFEDWKKAIKRKAHAEYTSSSGFSWNSSQIISSLIANRVRHDFGPYVDLTFLSEYNRKYGIATKSAWLQRSLTKLLTVRVEELLTFNGTGSGATPLQWQSDTIGALGPFTYNSYAAAIADEANIRAAVESQVGPVTQFNGILHYDPVATTLFFFQFLYVVSGIGPYPVGVTAQTSELPITNIKGIMNPNWAGGDVYEGSGVITQSFSTPEFVYSDVANCVHKQLGYTDIQGHGHYTLLGAFVQDDSTPEAADYVDACAVPPAKNKDYDFNGVKIPSSTPFLCSPETVTIDAENYTIEIAPLELPASTFLLQAGSIEPVYPDFAGAYVFDIQLKKWGKMKNPFKQLLSFYPINHIAGDEPIPYDIFGVNAAILAADGFIYLFDKFPTDSVIKFGKVGFYRKGFTDIDEIRAAFRFPSTGAILVEGSLDGKNLDPGILSVKNFTDIKQIAAPFSLSARWYNVVVSGTFDLTHLEFRGHRTGKR